MQRNVSCDVSFFYGVIFTSLCHSLLTQKRSQPHRIISSRVTSMPRLASSLLNLFQSKFS